jgi:hypothetical protein
MSIVNASEFVKTHIRRTWEAAEDANERTVAAEAVAAVFAAADGWLEVVALEASLGFYDREIFTEAADRPQQPWQLIRLQGADQVRVKPMYRPIESWTSAIDATSACAWIQAKLSETEAPSERYEASLRELLVSGSRVRLPGAASSESLRLECYAGAIDVPVDRGWVTAPFAPHGVPDPVSVRLTNLDGALRLTIDVFWSAWASAPEPVPAIKDGLARLEARGWREDE